jgi:hypothetical protein
MYGMPAFFAAMAFAFVCSKYLSRVKVDLTSTKVLTVLT